ncbi:aminotransferase class I/II-fold pyridoxal phosphate-dependent enzyme [Sorangium sp. So ce726]|uniref:trans-sulfuration enzyme family protein n=1 Tax=Sorangium sp. So ce726 TaxID=3133319 RepID=UPI003F637548
MKQRGPSTLVIHGDRAENPTRAVSPPIYQSSTYRWEDETFGGSMLDQVQPTEFYARWGHPNQKQMEAIVAGLEGAPRALAVGSGAAAALLSVLPFVSAGDHVVAARTLYGETANQLTALLPRLGVTCTRVPSNRTDDYREAITDKTKVVVIETPANPTLELVDIAAVAEIARASGARLAVDSTFATPLNTRPLELGAHSVFHSATKYLAGHSDVIAGVLAGDEEGIDRAWTHLRVMGPVLNPFDAWLVTRGLRTLALRVARHNDNGLAVAQLLAEHPAVARVNYPGLQSHEDHALAARQMRGFGGMLSVELRGGEAAARTFTRNVQLFSMATSLGGMESLVQYPAVLTPALAGGDAKRSGAAMVRLSVGCEDAADLREDLLQALSHV